MQLSQGLGSKIKSYSPSQPIDEDEDQDDYQLKLQSRPSQGLSHTDHQALQPKSSTTEEFQAKTHKVLFDEFIAISYCDRCGTLLGSFLKINLKFDLLFCTEID